MACSGQTANRSNGQSSGSSGSSGGSLTVQLIVANPTAGLRDTHTYFVAATQQHLAQMEALTNTYYNNFYIFKAAQPANSSSACVASVTGYQDEEVRQTLDDPVSSITSAAICRNVFGATSAPSHLPPTSLPVQPVPTGYPTTRPNQPVVNPVGTPGGCANPAKNLCTGP
jgi:hypothetical protein